MSEAQFETIIDDFAILEDWEDRYRYVIDLGKSMPPLPDSQKVATTKVDGCASQVWLVPHVDGAGPEARVSFDGDSDAMIVRGLIAVLRALYNGRGAGEAARLDAVEKLTALGLDQHLSSQRSNGLRAMITRIRTIARQAEEAAA